MHFERTLTISTTTPFPKTPPTIRLITTDVRTHMNIVFNHTAQGSLTPSDAKQLRDALIEAYPVGTFSEIKKGDLVRVILEVTHVDRRPQGVMFRVKAETGEWFDGPEAIGYVEPPKSKIEAGQLRQMVNGGNHYFVLNTPQDGDNVVAVRPNTPPGQPLFLMRRDVEASTVITP
jgi:hypothetical protein